MPGLDENPVVPQREGWVKLAAVEILSMVWLEIDIDDLPSDELLERTEGIIEDCRQGRLPLARNADALAE